MAQNGTSSASFTVSLRPQFSDLADGSNDLMPKIVLINQQREGFRNVTEEQLQLEMNQMEDDEASSSASDGEGDGDVKKGTTESIYHKRLQMARSLGTTREHGLFALDTLSLAASRALEQGFQTASPAIQETIPPASFSYSRRDPLPPASDPKLERKEKLLWLGSSMTNNTEAADALLAAATRLEGLVKAETEYWGQLLSLTSNGWPVYKPGPMEAMHVRFVASEASPQFKMQGVARLTPDKNGIIRLGSRVGTEPRTLRLRHCRGGEVLASSVTASLLSLADLGSSLEDKVRKEQSSLFEEELFQEMTLESRTLQPLGVKMRENVLHLPLDTTLANSDEYLIDLIPIDEASDTISTAMSKHKELLDTQSVLLRLLLCHVYRLRLKRRSKPPPPLADNPRKEPPSNIVRTFMAITQHQIACQPLTSYLTGLSKLMSKADIPIACSETRIPGLQEIFTKVKDAIDSESKHSALHQLLEGATSPQKTTAVLDFTIKAVNGTSSKHAVKVEAFTNLSPPIFGTEFTLDLPQEIARLNYGAEASGRKLTFLAFRELKEYLSSLVSMQIARQVLLPLYPDFTPMNDMPVLSRTLFTTGQPRGIAIGIKVDDREVELRCRRFGGQSSQNRESWTATTQNSKSLLSVFAAWASEP